MYLRAREARTVPITDDGGVPAGIRDKVESMRFTGIAA